GPAARAAAQIGVDPALLLGVAALESTWGTTDQALRLNNPFGYIPRPGQPSRFPSLDAAWQRWTQTFGPRVSNLGSDAEAFIHNLQLDNRTVYGPTVGGDRRGKYNSETSVNWPDLVRPRVTAVRHQLPHWQGNLDGMP